MWAQALSPLRSRLHRTVRFARSYNGQYQTNAQGLPTYFQQPVQPAKPQRRILRSVLFGAGCFIAGGLATTYLLDWIEIEELIDQAEADERAVQETFVAGLQQNLAKHVPVIDLERARELLHARAGFSITPTAVGHFTQLPSNSPCEDEIDSGIYNLFHDKNKDWANWSLFDGHAGARTAGLLKEHLAVVVGHELWQNGCMDRKYVPDDFTIIRSIKRAFTKLDSEMLQAAAQRLSGGEADRGLSVSMLAPAVAGSCALIALFDPVRSVLRVANTGDSRAVLGRWDAGMGKYVAKAMSVDQTGFNVEEVERLRQEHPEEEPVDEKTGRVLGLAVTRAFGDARWKWSNEMTKTVYEKFWGPAPRPNGVVMTPPYLTAEPEVMETQVQSGEHPDFLIMASDGLWDNMSSEDAVTCVQQWLDKNKPTNFVDLALENALQIGVADPNKKGASSSIQAGPMPRAYKPDFTSPGDEDEETYWDENERSLKWKVSPKHFIVEDDHCGVHLIRNALGGRRRNLFRGVMSIQPPYSRNVRDDISVHVIFFGIDPSITAKLKAEGDL